MAKKLSLLLAAVAVAALAAPPFASAVGVTDGKGKLLPVGTVIVGKSKSRVLETGFGKVTCESWVQRIKLTKNTTESVQGVGVGEGEVKGCKLGTGEKSSEVKFTDPTLIGFSWTLFSGVSITETFIAHFPKLTCHFEGAAGVSVTFGGGHLTIGPANLKGTPSGCGQGLLTDTTSFEQSGGGTVVFD